MTPQDLGGRLRAARNACGLSPSEVESLAGVGQGDLGAWESGSGVPSPRSLERLARLYGWTSDTLCDPKRSPEVSGYGVLLRSRDAFPVVLAQLERITKAISIFREMADLDTLIAGSSSSKNEPIQGARSFVQSLDKSYQDWKVGESCAIWVRDQLGLGSAPISSVTAVLRRLGIRIVWAHLGTDSPDGLSFLDREMGPGVVLNLDPDWAWRTRRLTAAHELCHCLFHPNDAMLLGRVCREGDTEQIERVARAFAAYFLAPRKEFDRFLTALGLSKGSSQLRISHIHQCMEYFGMGFQSVVSHLSSCEWISRDTYKDWRSSDRPALPASKDQWKEGPKDAFLEPAIFPFMEAERVELAPVALDAWERGLITQAALRSYWGATPYHRLDRCLEYLIRLGLASSDSKSRLSRPQQESEP